MKLELLLLLTVLLGPASCWWLWGGDEEVVEAVAEVVDEQTEAVEDILEAVNDVEIELDAENDIYPGKTRVC